MTNKLSVFFKTMVLYMMGRVDFDLTAAQIGEFMVMEDYVSFFSFQQLLFELERDQMVSARKAGHNTYYHLEEAGRECLDYFGSSLQPEIREEIDQYVSGRKWEMADAGSLRTDYTLNANGDYAVRLQAFENSEPVLDLTVTVPDEATARSVCAKWKEQNAEIYAYIMAHLL